MSEGALVRILAKLPPSKWPTAIERFPVLAAYSDLPEPTAKDADRAAELLGIQRRMFYHLLQEYRALANSDACHGVRADSRVLHPVTLKIVEDTIAELGSTASESEIMLSIRQQCAALGAPVHSEGMMRTRLGRVRHKDLGRRLGVAADLIIDSCALEVDTFQEFGCIAAAGMTAVIEVSTGAILSHAVTVGLSSDTVARKCLGEAVDCLPRPAETVRYTSNVNGIDQMTLAEFGLAADISRARHVKGGLPLTVALGSRLGRIRLRPRNKAHLPSELGAAVDLVTLTSVLANLIEAYNQGVGTNVTQAACHKWKAACEPWRHSETAFQPDQGRSRTTDKGTLPV